MLLTNIPLERLFKLHVLIIHLMYRLLHLLLFARDDDRCLRGLNNSIWTNLHGIGMLSRYDASTRSLAGLELLLTHYLGMNIPHVSIVIRMTLGSHAVYRRNVLTMGV